MCFIGHERGADRIVTCCACLVEDFPDLRSPNLVDHPISGENPAPRRRGTLDRPKAKIIDSSHVFILRRGEIDGYYLLHPRPTQKPFEDRRNHENSTLNILRADGGWNLQFLHALIMWLIYLCFGLFTINIIYLLISVNFPSVENFRCQCKDIAMICQIICSNQFNYHWFLLVAFI